MPGPVRCLDLCDAVSHDACRRVLAAAASCRRVLRSMVRKLGDESVLLEAKGWEFACLVLRPR